MFCVRLDIHSKRISLCVLNETGQVVHRSQVRTIDQMMRILEGLPERFEVCYEASCGYGHFHDLLSPVAARVLVAIPGRLRLIFRSAEKNDRKDAERLSPALAREILTIQGREDSSESIRIARKDSYPDGWRLAWGLGVGLIGWPPVRFFHIGSNPGYQCEVQAYIHGGRIVFGFAMHAKAWLYA